MQTTAEHSLQSWSQCLKVLKLRKFKKRRQTVCFLIAQYLHNSSGLESPVSCIRQNAVGSTVTESVLKEGSLGPSLRNDGCPVVTRLVTLEP